MSSSLVRYHTDQAGSGIAGFHGVKYQKGHGLWGSLFGFLRPAFRYLGKKALSTGMDIAEDVIDGNNFKTSAMSRLRDTGKNIAGDAIARGRQFAQTGTGRRRRRKYRVKSKFTKVGKRKSIKGRKEKRKVHRNSLKNLKPRKSIKVKRRKRRGKSNFDFLK